MNADITAVGKKDWVSKGELGPGLSPRQGELVRHGGGIAAPADSVLAAEGVGGHGFWYCLGDWAACRINPEYPLEADDEVGRIAGGAGLQRSLFFIFDLKKRP